MNRTYVSQLLTKVLGESYEIESRLMGSMMNISYLVKDAKENRYVLTLPNGNSNKLFNRKYEEKILNNISKSNITAETIYFDTIKGIKIVKYIEGETLKNKDVLDYAALADSLHKLHDTKEKAPHDFNPFVTLLSFENKALLYKPETNVYRIMRDYLSSNSDQLESGYDRKLCHNHLFKDYVVDSEDGYKFINFEFASNNDPIYDIACFATDSLEDGENLLYTYFKKVDSEQLKRFYLWRVYLSLLWYNIAVIKHFKGEGKTYRYNFENAADYYIKIGIQAYNKCIKIK